MAWEGKFRACGNAFKLLPVTDPLGACLSRYGDPLSANADLDSMQRLLKHHVNPGAMLFLAVPVGKDAVVFNAHRIYGQGTLQLHWHSAIDSDELSIV